MNFKIRTTKTKSGNIAVQVVDYVKRKTIILKHVGSASNAIELEVLKEEAKNWILHEQNTKSLFRISFNETDTFNKTYKYLGVKLIFAYEFLEKIYIKFNFPKYVDNLIKYLVITQILEPGSKRANALFLEEKLGIK